MREEGFFPQDVLPDVDSKKREWLRECLLKASYVAEGKDGVVLCVPDEVSEKGKMAVKMLKVFDERIGKGEVDAQQGAFYALRDSGATPDTHAMVPEPYEVCSVHLSDDIVRIFKEKTNHEFGERVVVELMEYVEGEEFLSYIQRQAGKLLSASGRTIQRIDLQSNHRGDMQRAELVRQENVAELIRVMQLSAVGEPAIHPSILDKIHCTIRLLHNSGIFHRDLHERNIMVREKDDGSFDVYIIDFGHSVCGIKKGDDPYEGSGNMVYMRDETLVYRYRPLTKTKEQSIKEREAHKKNKIFSYLNTIERRGKSKEFFVAVQRISDMLREQDESSGDTSWVNALYVVAKDFSFGSTFAETHWRVALLVFSQAADMASISAQHRKILSDYLVNSAKKLRVPSGIIQDVYMV